jgi:serine phosphatase RsbU (regulator of sigma subunit)
VSETFASGGDPPAMLVSKGAIRPLESQNGILGYLWETAPSECADEIDLDAGDRLVLFTDGLVEVFNGADAMLGVEGLSSLVLQAAKLPLPKMRQSILDGVVAWQHGALADDVSLVIEEVR